MSTLCKACGQDKPASEFYVSSRTRCKACVRARVSRHRAAHLDEVRAYDRARTNTPKRLAHLARNTRQWRMKNPERYAAHTAVSNAIRDGKLAPEPCCVCKTEPAHAHHEDYSKPLSVIWLCPEHHHQYHLIRRVAEKVLGEAA